MAGGGFNPIFKPHPPAFQHRFLSKALGATMWFWMMYRLREDGGVIFGFRHPWDGHGGHDDHGHGDSHGH